MAALCQCGTRTTSPKESISPPSSTVEQAAQCTLRRACQVLTRKRKERLPGILSALLLLNLHRKKIEGNTACEERIDKLINPSNTFGKELSRPRANLVDS